jgi:hypothetical protein
VEEVQMWTKEEIFKKIEKQENITPDSIIIFKKFQDLFY